MGDGYEWGRLNLQSVTEESRLDEFLSTAQLAGTEFTAGVCGQLAYNYSPLRSRMSRYPATSQHTKTTWLHILDVKLHDWDSRCCLLNWEHACLLYTSDAADE